MLPHTFCHLSGVGPATERRWWVDGIQCWEDALSTDLAVPRSGRTVVMRELEESRRALAADPHFFTARLPGHQAWRIFPHFREHTAYLDIETCPAGDFCDITAITLYDGHSVRVYVNGRNLEDFPGDLEVFSVLVSYNGRSFDIPVIERFFHLRVEQAQIDLRHVLARLGCRGGLKGCEKQFGIHRGLLDGVDGSSAVALWRQYQRYDDEAALQTLLAYNVEDTVNLERLMVEAYNRHRLLTPFGDTGLISYPEPPLLPYCADAATVSRLRTAIQS